MNRIRAFGIVSLTLLLLVVGTIAGVFYGPAATILAVFIVSANLFSGIGGFLLGSAVESHRRVQRYRKAWPEKSLPYTEPDGMTLIDCAIIGGSIVVVCLFVFGLSSWVLTNFVIPTAREAITL